MDSGLNGLHPQAYAAIGSMRDGFDSNGSRPRSNPRGWSYVQFAGVMEGEFDERIGQATWRVYVPRPVADAATA